MVIIDDIKQGTPEWFAARVGIPSASCFSQIITSRGVPSKSAEKYMRKLAGERIVGTQETSYSNAAMQRGIEIEPEARSYFELIKGAEVQQVGLIYKDEKKDRSCSPDGIIDNRMGIEIKCPSMAVQVEYLLQNKLPTDYFQQVQGSMYTTGFSQWYFVSYYPGMPVLILCVERDVDFCAKLGKALDKFCADLDGMHSQLKGMM